MNESSTLQNYLNILKQQLPPLAEEYGVEWLGLFGSYVREEARVDSDLDILVRFRRAPGLLRYVELENYLSDLLGVKVDLVMENSLKPRIGKRIRKEVVAV